MSSNKSHNDPMLTRDNYEEFFLLYVDGELTPEAKKAVDDFVALHPDLKEELDLLCSTKLPAEDFHFEGKAALFADSMKLTAADEALLLYIDNELPKAEAAKIAAQIAADKTIAAQHQLFMKTKLDATEQILYPNKKELYRRTERRIAPVWLRVAAAVAVLISGTAIWINMDHSKAVAAPVAVVTPKTQPAQLAKKRGETSISNKDVEHVTVTAVTEKNTVVQKENSLAVNTTSSKQKEKKGSKPIFSKPHIVEDAVALTKPAPSNNLPVVKKVTMPVVENEIAHVPQQPINKVTVTPDAPKPYIQKEAAANSPVPDYAVATDNERESGGMKGLLRKATRFIEKRTGIKAVNDDNELLVGAVAVKL